jgi:hypothetical protein
VWREVVDVDTHVDCAYLGNGSCLVDCAVILWDGDVPHREAQRHTYFFPFASAIMTSDAFSDNIYISSAIYVPGSSATHSHPRPSIPLHP